MSLATHCNPIFGPVVHIYKHKLQTANPFPHMQTANPFSTHANCKLVPNSDNTALFLSAFASTSLKNAVKYTNVK